MKKKNFLALTLALLFLILTPASINAAVSREWSWQNAGDEQGWSRNEQIDNWIVTNGRYTLHISDMEDPNITSPTISIDTSVYKILEITYRNTTGNTDAKLYWRRDGEGFSEARAKSIRTQSDNRWHTLQVDLEQMSSWSGTVVQLRFDPTMGGNGNFELDKFSLLDKKNRYMLSNGYYEIGGVDGLIDMICFDPQGKGNYSEDLVNGNLFLSLDYNGSQYSSTSDQVAWSVIGTVLQLQNIHFYNSGLVGNWRIELNGNRMKNTFTITSGGDNKKLTNVGFVMDTPWENSGYEVEASPAGTLKVPFSKMVSSADRYHSAYAYKRTSSEDNEAFGLEGDWIDWQGANGYNFNLRFYPDTKYLSPVCSTDNMRLHFRKANTETITLNNNQAFTRTLDIVLSSPGDVTPSHFTRFEGGDPTVTKALNDMLYEFGYAREAGCTNPDWWEWISLTRAWQDDNYRQVDVDHTLTVRQSDNGYVWTWGNLEGWPFPTDRDSNHYLMTSANYINAVYNYFMYSGDLDYLDSTISKMRSSMSYLLTKFDSASGLFIIDHPDHDGTSRSVGSNYWDIIPYGYKSAYDNIYCYNALRRMAEIEAMLGNSARAAELNGYADTLKRSYNAAFWHNNHYIQVIDANGAAHDYGCVYLNLEAINYGLADTDRAAAIMNYLKTTATASGKADALSAFAFAPRTTMVNNPHNSQGGWYVSIYNSDGIYGTSQLQNGGANFYTMYYELMSRLKTSGADDAYARLTTLVNRFNMEHMQGGNPLYYGEKNQHGSEGNVGLWGEFPESGLVPVVAKDGFMGISADSGGLHVAPNFPATGMTSLTLDSVDYWGMKLKITASNSSVRIQALENNSPYTDWRINGAAAVGRFDITVPISSGGTVTLARGTSVYSLADIS